MSTNKVLRCLVSFCFSLIISMNFLACSSQAKAIDREVDDGNRLNIDLNEIVITALVLTFSYGALERFRSKD